MAPKQTSRECILCLESYIPNSVHPCHICTQRQTCDHCILQHISANLDRGQFQEIKCPEANCSAKLPSENVMEFLQQTQNKQEQDRYDRFLNSETFTIMPGFIWCAHNCGCGMINEDKEAAPIVTCYNCHRKTCYIHKDKWHEGLTCTEFDDELKQMTNREAEEKQSIAYIEKYPDMFKRCPKCSYYIEKNGGCDHMMCHFCKYEFFWTNLQPYKR